MNKSLYTAIIISVLATYACTATLPTQGQVYPNPVPVPRQCVTITGDVYIRDSADVRTGYGLLQGAVVCGHVVGDWFEMNGGYKVFLGCTTQADGRGCRSE